MTLLGLPQSEDPRLLQLIELHQRWGGPQGALGSGTLLLIENTAYHVYLGRVVRPFVPAYLKVFCGTIGSGAQTAEMGFSYSPLPPNAANQTITKLMATGTISDLTTTGVKQNSTAFTTYAIPGMFLWGSMRTAMAGNEPTLQALNRDYARGMVLTTAAAGALTSGTSWTGAVVAATAATSEAPVTWLALDP